MTLYPASFLPLQWSHLHIAVKSFFQGDQCFGPLNAFDLLELIMQHMPELCNIAAYDLYEHAVIARGIIKPHDLGYFAQLFCY